jgi:hypothetical protein
MPAAVASGYADVGLPSAKTKKETCLLREVDTVGSGIRLLLWCPGQRLQSDGFNFPTVSDPELGGDLHVTRQTNEGTIQHIALLIFWSTIQLQVGG